MAELLPISNREVGAISAGFGPEKKYEVKYELAKGRGECEDLSLNGRKYKRDNNNYQDP